MNTDGHGWERNSRKWRTRRAEVISSQWGSNEDSVPLRTAMSALQLRVSDFGLLSSLGLRGFGFPPVIPPLPSLFPATVPQGPARPVLRAFGVFFGHDA